ncbi:glycoside hydrolase family 2 protein [Pseudalkalibacillus sp. R45]|uniref:glycoside hydrolase family 2 protein n=1 Tax=Pseudalkalibacillus sp. R45 TaxID=3457433 RepID=UPI003FCD15DC
MTSLDTQLIDNDQCISLSGEWEVYVDFDQPIDDVREITEQNGWKIITVPSCWEQHESNKLAEGPVWYRKSFEVPTDWRNAPIVIEFKAVNYYCELWVNGKKAGSHEGGWNGFEMDVTEYILYGNKNEVLLKVYKQGGKFPIRECLAGFFPDVGVIFGGIWKPVYVKKLTPIRMKDIFIKPRIDERKITVDYLLEQQEPAVSTYMIRSVIIDEKNNEVGGWEQHLKPDIGTMERTASINIFIKEPLQLWEPESPHLYTLKFSITQENKLLFTAEEKFGMREVTVEHDRILLNGKPVYLRGVLHWGWYGDHIAPTPTKEEIIEELTRVKENGFNLIKHCLYVPTKEYLQTADEMGVLIWQELPMWLPEVSETFEQRVNYQYEQIISEIRNHPSIILWTLGCELNHQVNASFLEQLFHKTKKLTDYAIIRDNSGSGECYGGLLKEFADFYDYHFYNDFHFYRDLINQFAGSWREQKPWLFGEFCDYDTYRNLDEVREKYNGELPWWLMDDPIKNPGSRETRWHWYRQEEKMKKLDIPFSNQELDENSKKSAFVYRKAVLELVRTYQKINGYVLTSIKGNPVATSAIFNDFGLPNHEPDKLRSFNDETILSLTWDNRRDWINGGDRLINWDPYNYLTGNQVRPHLFVSHYSSQPVENCVIDWEYTLENGEALDDGTFIKSELPVGEAQEIGVMEVTAPKVMKPTKLILTATLSCDTKSIKNEWPLWIYPESKLGKDQQFNDIWFEDPMHLYQGIKNLFPLMRYERYLKSIQPHVKCLVTTMLRSEHIEYVRNGGKVLYIQRGEGEFPIEKLPFWRESIQLFHKNQYMDDFPHEDHTGLAFYGLASDTAFIAADDPKRTPIMGRLDARTFDLHDYMFEKTIGKGYLVATTLRFEGGLGSQPSGIEHNPAGRYWLESIIQNLLIK